MKSVMEASHAISEAVKAVEPDVIPAYPITPQTHIVEKISEYVANGEIKSRYLRAESEFGAISQCLGASAAGARAYTSTSSQGLALMHEVLFIVSGMRLPVCMSVVNRALSAPINIWNDHQDTMSERETGWMQFYVETAQEGYDLSLMQFAISEDSKVLTPSMVCMDGFTLSHVYEPVEIHEKSEVKAFLPDYKPVHAVLDPEQPLTQGSIGFPETYMETRKSQQDAMDAAFPVIEKVFEKYSKRFPATIAGSRPEKYYHVEEYKLEDAEIAFLAMGSVCGTIKDVVDQLREQGEKVGLLKLITFRPLPKDALINSLKNINRVAVCEKAISVGGSAPLVSEVKDAFYDEADRPDIRSFIVGLGGRDVSLDRVEKVYRLTKEGKGAKQEWVY